MKSCRGECVRRRSNLKWNFDLCGRILLLAFGIFDLSGRIWTHCFAIIHV